MPPTSAEGSLARVFADTTALEQAADMLGRLRPVREEALGRARASLDHYFASAPLYGPASADIETGVQRYINDAHLDAVGLLATTDAFRRADRLHADVNVGVWVVTDAWIEAQRRLWLTEHYPDALSTIATTMDAAVLARELASVQAQLVAMGRAGVEADAAGALVQYRDVLVAEAIAAVDGISDSLRAWDGSENDPVVDALVANRRRLIEALVAGERFTAAQMERMVNQHRAASPSFFDALRLGATERRVLDFMDAHGLARAQAIERLAIMDAQLAAMIADGHSAETAMAAFALAEANDLNLDDILAVAEESGRSPLEVLGTRLAARGLDMTDAEFEAYLGLQEHFDAFDAALGPSDGRVSFEDLIFVVENPGRFTTAQVDAAAGLLARGRLLVRLDSAAGNGDILDDDAFGDVYPGDRLISNEDLDAFLRGTTLNRVLAPYRTQLDTAADGGLPDGVFSRRDLEAWLDNPANADVPVEVRTGVESMLDAGLYDETWMERHRDDLAMGAALVAGGAVVVFTGGGGVLVIVASTTAAGATTVAVNAYTSEALTEGLLANVVDGVLVGVSVAGLPAATAAATAPVASGEAFLTAERIMAGAAVTSETANIVSRGGLDLLVPEDWEGDVHDVAGNVATVAGAPSAAGDMVDVVDGDASLWVIGELGLVEGLGALSDDLRSDQESVDEERESPR